MGDAKVGDRLDVFMETSVWLIKTGLCGKLVLII